MSTEEEQKNLTFVFDMYSTHGLIDAADVIDAVYGLHLCPTRSLVLQTVGTDKRGEKLMNFEDFMKIYTVLKDNKDQGGFHDFVECLKTFDIAENGTMKLNDLVHLLLSLGERLSDNEMTQMMSECMLEEEDDEGYIPYLPFLCRLCDQPLPKDNKTLTN